MSVLPLYSLSDAAHEFEPNEAIAAKFERDEQTLAAMIVETITALRASATPAMEERIAQLELLASEHRQVCSDLMNIEVRKAVLAAFDAGQQS